MPNGNQVETTPGRVTRRTFLGQSALAGASLALGTHAVEGGPAAADQAAPSRRPNLLFVFSDQQSFDMLGCYGNQQIVTPNIDRAASQGLRFNHCVSSSPVCTPYRGMLMSGQHPLYNGAMWNDLRLLAGGGNYFGQVLRDAGYRMGYVGKWHLYGGYRNRPIPPGPFRYGFDGTFLSNNCQVNFMPGHCYYWNDQGEKIFFDKWEPQGQTDQAIEFLDGCSGQEPFALFVSWHPPHNHAGPNYPAPEELLKLYDPAKIKLRSNCPDTPRNRENYCGHMALCTSVDQCFGRLMDKLRQKGLADNTIVVFTSDHGDALNSRGWTQYKCRPEDEACRVPLIIRWPKRLKPRSSDLLVGTLNLMPTILGMLELPIPETCQGENLTEAVFSEHDDAVQSVPLFIIHGRGWRGIYTHAHTYAFEHASPPGKPLIYSVLFDKKNDPTEANNLFYCDAHKSLRDELHRQTLAWMDRFGDTFVPSQTLNQVCRVNPELRLNHPTATGELKGRPIDLLKSS